MASRSFTLPLPGAPAADPAPAAAGARRVPGRRAARRGLVALLLLALVAGGGWRLLRDSSLVAVKDVEITGVSGPQADAIRSALTAAAQDQTTLHVRDGALLKALADYPLVASVRATGDFPHRMTISVREHEPVASLHAGGEAVAVAADGTLLRGVRGSDLPTVPVATLPAGRRLSAPLALAQVRILAAAPAALRARVTKTFTGARGLAVQLKDGPAVAFGAPERLPAKWLSLAAVLAEPSSAGGTLIDLSVPERPAVVGAPTPGAAAGGTAAEPTTPGDLTDPADPAAPAATDPASGAPAVTGTGAPAATPVTPTP